MTDYNWCHGPECHKRHTQDRIRGVKGSKVLRTRKIAQTKWNEGNQWSHFCSQGCWNDFAFTHWNEFINLHPRTEALETPIEVQVETRTDWHGNPYKQKVIQAIDNG
tara:strand:- start:232 stop:552 length:321 start_codon:yes stop_codon:yes gene_type:complete